jgi:hypothetical protein
LSNVKSGLGQGVKDKERIKDPKFSLKMLIFPNNCQFGSIFWISLDEADAFLVNKTSQMQSRNENATLNPFEPLKAYNAME